MARETYYPIKIVPILNPNVITADSLFCLLPGICHRLPCSVLLFAVCCAMRQTPGVAVFAQTPVLVIPRAVSALMWVCPFWKKSVHSTS